MKKLLALSLVLVVLLFAAGCAGAEEEKSEITIGVVVYDEFDTFVGQLMDVFMDSVSDAMAKNGIKINVIRQASAGSQITQNDQVEELIKKGCDVVCVNLVDRTDPSMIIEAARDADVPVVFFNRELVIQDLDSWDKLYYVGADAYDSGNIEGQIVADAFNSDESLDKNGDGQMQVVVLEGEAGHQDAIIRSEYSVSTIMNSGITVDKLESAIANWKRAEGQTKMARMLDKYGDEIEVVLSNNDDMALGAIDEYDSRGITMDDRPVIVGIDGTDVGLEAVQNGTMLGTVYNDKEKQGQAMVDLAVALALGQDPDMPDLVDGKYIRFPYARVERDNVSQFLER
ncbi:MAG: galactose ABC transporter substrate-binding protein [Lachnospiraceae bacterium]|nr:galactose ABC transporter substrate-binding protein [Lachnospiraceae bacterium]